MASLQLKRLGEDGFPCFLKFRYTFLKSINPLFFKIDKPFIYVNAD